MTTAQAFVAEIQSLSAVVPASSAVTSSSSPAITVISTSASHDDSSSKVDLKLENSPQSANEAVTITVETSQSSVNNHSPTTVTEVQSNIVPTIATATQLIAVAVSDNTDRSDQDQVVQEAVTLQAGQASTLHPTYVQYVDQGTTNLTDPTNNIYAASNGQMTYSVYSVSEGGSMYTPSTATYYNTSATNAVTPSQVGGIMTANAGSVIGSPTSLQGQILTTAHGNAYVVQGIAPAGTLDAEVGQLAHATRASPATVQWLVDNYETAEGVSLPRRTLYQHYCRHCSNNKIKPINAASFGKLIRSVFLGLRTRRLGTRGNSKYHYYGLRVKPDSPLVHLSEDHNSAALRQQPLGTHKRVNKTTVTRIDQNGSNPSLSNQQSTSSSDPNSPTTVQLSQTHQIQPNPQQQQHQQYLGDSSMAVPHFINVDFANNHLPEGITIENVNTFVEMYRDHCESFLDVVTNLQFSMVEMLWQNFWRCQSGQNLTAESDRRLSKVQLYALCKCEVIQEYVRRTDYQFYQNLVDVLIPDVLRPIPSSLTQAIRNFAKSLEGWLASSMTECPDDIVSVKVSAVSAFAQTLRRYTSLNHLAQAARAVLQNSSQIQQMLADLNRVDFHNVQEQASWVCQCDDIVVQKLEEDFKATLQQQNSLEQWASWLEGVVTQVLRPFEGKVDFPKAARQFLLKWSFYSSMVIRDLTLRSAASFGSFHLIRLLYDEFMFYLIEHRVAEATCETPIAVIGEFIGLGTKSSTSNNKDGINYSGGLNLVPNHSVNFAHQLCSERSTDSESSTSSTGRNGEAIDIPIKRMKTSL